MALAPSLSLERIAVLTAGVLILALPLVWIAWSLAAVADAAEAVRVRSETLASLRQRLPELAASEDGRATSAAAESPYLPGGTAAIAGAALQRLVADTVAEAGGRLAESEIIASAAEGDSARVDLRVSFDTDIAGLQRILFTLETGAPILMLHSLNVQSADAIGQAGSEQPVLRVVMLVGGYREAQA